MRPPHALTGTRSRADGFTLIELLVVLAILGALTLVAVRSLDPLQRRSRFEATQRVLADVERALLGEPYDPDAARRAGYVADLGDLPAAPGAGDPLAALWSAPPTLASSHLEGEAGRQLAVGWRGPYVALPPGDAALRDGWGNPLAVDATPTRWAFGSLGADGQLDLAPPIDPYDADTWIVLRDEAPPIERVRSAVLVEVTIEPQESGGPGATPAGGQVRVVAYAPDPATGGLRIVESPPQPLTGFGAVLSFSFDTGAGLTIGPRAFQATLDVDGDPEPEARSALVRRTLLPGAQALAIAFPVQPSAQPQ